MSIEAMINMVIITNIFFDNYNVREIMLLLMIKIENESCILSLLTLNAITVIELNYGFYIDNGNNIYFLKKQAEMGQQCSRQFCDGPVQHQPYQMPPLVITKKSTNRLISMKSIHDDQKLIEQKQEEYLQLQEQILSKKQTIIMQSKRSISQTEDFVDYQRFVHSFRKMLYLYKQHQIDAAYDLVKQLIIMETDIKKERNTSQQEFEAQLKKIQKQKQRQYEFNSAELFDRQIFEVIEKEHQDMVYYFNESVKAPFAQKYNKNGIRISTRKDEKNFAFLVETELHSPFENLTTFLTDITYFPDVLPFCEKAALIQDGGRNSKVGYAVIDFPMLSKRQAFFETLAYNRMDFNREVFLYARSIHDKPEVQRALGVEIRPNKKYVQLGYKFFVIRYEPLAERVGNLKISANFDLGMDFLPQFVEEYAVREFGKRLIKRILQINENFEGSKWEKGLEMNPGMYLIVKEKIQEYLRNLKNKE